MVSFEIVCPVSPNAANRGTAPDTEIFFFSGSHVYFAAFVAVMKPTCFTPSGTSIPFEDGAFTMYMRSDGATRPSVVLYQRRLFHPNVLSTAMKKPFTMRLATVPSASDSRSASFTLSGFPGSFCCHQGLAGSSSGSPASGRSVAVAGGAPASSSYTEGVAGAPASSSPFSLAASSLAFFRAFFAISR